MKRKCIGLNKAKKPYQISRKFIEHLLGLDHDLIEGLIQQRRLTCDITSISKKT